MKISEETGNRQAAIVDLFAETFAASEGADEGALIGGVARDLLRDTPAPDIRVFLATDADRLIGAAIFTRLSYPEDPKVVFLLSPMAVAPNRQGQGVGQALLTEALARLGAGGVNAAVTYGDPAFYGRVGFKPLSEDQARAPLPLSYPHGWIGQSLTGGEMPALKGPSKCVPPLDRADIW